MITASNAPVKLGGLTFRIEAITPEIAESILTQNHVKNRKVKKNAVISYARQMIKGLWRSRNGESIKLSGCVPKAVLLDGQHRLLGVIEAGKTNPAIKVDMLIIDGIEISDISSLDDGVKRTIADALVIDGKMKHSGRLTGISSALRTLRTIQYAVLNDVAFQTLNSYSRPSVADICAFVENLGDFSESNEKYCTEYRYGKIEKLIPQSSTLAMFHILRKINPKVTNDIMLSLETGLPHDGLGVLSPMYHVMERIREKKMIGIPIKIDENVNFILWAFNLMHKGDTRKAKLSAGRMPWQFNKDFAAYKDVKKMFQEVEDRSIAHATELQSHAKELAEAI